MVFWVWNKLLMLSLQRRLFLDFIMASLSRDPTANIQHVDHMPHAFHTAATSSPFCKLVHALLHIAEWVTAWSRLNSKQTYGTRSAEADGTHINNVRYPPLASGMAARKMHYFTSSHASHPFCPRPVYQTLHRLPPSLSALCL